MKILIVLCLVVFCVSFSEQKSRYTNCPKDHVKVSDPKIRDGCYDVICRPEKYGGSDVKTCPNFACLPGRLTGYKEDISKTFPDCCAEPICE